MGITLFFGSQGSGGDLGELPYMFLVPMIEVCGNYPTFLGSQGSGGDLGELPYLSLVPRIEVCGNYLIFFGSQVRATNQIALLLILVSPRLLEGSEWQSPARKSPAMRKC